MVEVAVGELSVEVVETSSRSRRPRVAERSREVEVVVGESMRLDVGVVMLASVFCVC